MRGALDRRSFLGLCAFAGAATLVPRWVRAQAAQSSNRTAQDTDEAARTPVKVTKLYDNVYWLQGAGGNMLLQTGADGDLLVDASFPAAVPQVLKAIAATSSDRPATLINTHWHFDHTGGNEGLHAAGFKIVAHENTRIHLARGEEIKLLHVTSQPAAAGALPSITIDKSARLWTNGDSVDVIHFDPAHTDSDVYIHFHKADVLHMGDTWFHGIYPFIDEGTGGGIGGMIAACDKALAVAGKDTKIVPGHGPVGTRADLEKYRDMLVGVREKVAMLKAKGLSEKEALAQKPTAEWDSLMGAGIMTPEAFAGIVYRTL